MNWLRYLLEANLYLCIFYLLYRLLLSRETHYTLSRAYLLSGPLISFVLPILQVGALRSFNVQANVITIPAPAVILTNGVSRAHTASPLQFNWQDAFIYLYFAGAVVCAALLFIKLLRLFMLGRKQQIATGNGYKLVEVGSGATAFSFFNTVFIGPETSDRETIISHELVHIRQKHSIDILLLELIKITCWFNPVVYLLQNSLKAVHEFIADEKTAKTGPGTLVYSTFLVNRAYGIAGPSVTHSIFNKNLLKRRIIMLNQKPSSIWARLKYLLILPVCAGLLCVSTLAFNKTYGAVDLMPMKDLPANTTTTLIAPKTIVSNTGKIIRRNEKYIDSNEHVTPKGYHYTESVVVHNGKTDLQVIITPTEKNTDQLKVLRSVAGPKIIKMLKEKYGYTFPAEIPPPPAPPAQAAPHSPNAPAVNKIPPPAIAPVGVTAPSAPAKPRAAMPPPMAPHMPLAGPFDGFQKYLSKYTLYPAAEFEKRVTGSVIIQFDINADHKIANASVIKGFATACDNEALSVLKKYDETIDKTPGTYKVAISFYLYGLKAPAPASSTFHDDPSFIGEVVIEGMPK